MVDGGHSLNTWFDPLTRDVPPRVSPAQETLEMENDLNALSACQD